MLGAIDTTKYPVDAPEGMVTSITVALQKLIVTGAPFSNYATIALSASEIGTQHHYLASNRSARFRDAADHGRRGRTLGH